MSEIKTVAQANRAIERLCKWRNHFSGWLLGTRPKGDPQSQWARDMAEKALLHRVEITALLALLVEKGLITAEEFTIQVGHEAEYLSEAMSRKWPGVRATDLGLSYDMEEINRAGWMKNWLP